MNDLADRGAMGQKEPKAVKDPERLRDVARTPCVICHTYNLVQRSRTEVHHCKSARYSQAKECDSLTIGLCQGHHHRLRAIPGEEDYIGFHNSQKTWEAEYGLDYYFIPLTNRLIEQMNDEALAEWF